MEHTQKFVLVDPRFVRPSMRDRTLSGLDADISNILESDASDEMKPKNYADTLSSFKHIFNPPLEKPKPAEKPKTQALPAREKKLRYKIKQLQNRLGRKERLEFDDGGKLDQANISDSDISELTVDDPSEVEAEWEQLKETPHKKSTPHSKKQPARRDAGYKAPRNWAEMLDRMPKSTRKSSRPQTKRKTWVQY